MGADMKKFLVFSQKRNKDGTTNETLVGEGILNRDSTYGIRISLGQGAGLKLSMRERVDAPVPTQCEAAAMSEDRPPRRCDLIAGHAGPHSHKTIGAPFQWPREGSEP